jgi:hypothetical protein
MGPAGAAEGVASLVVCEWYEYAYPTCSAYYNDDLYIFGSGFQPGALVMITICDRNYILATEYADTCGAFYVEVYMPDDLYEYQLDDLMTNYGDWTVSVRAWVGAIDINDDNELEPAEYGKLWANWPLFIYDEMP